MKPKRKKKRHDKYAQYKRTITKLAADRDRYKERYYYMLAAYEKLSSQQLSFNQCFATLYS